MLLRIGLVSLLSLTGACEKETPKTRITLKNKGDGALPQAIRYRLTPGTVQRGRLVASAETKVRGRKMSVPALLMNMTYEINNVDASGNADISFVIDGAGAEGKSKMAQAMDVMMQATIGMGGNMKVDSRGATEKISLQLPEKMPQEMRGQLDHLSSNMEAMAVPFPKQAISVGAKWSAVSSIEMQGIRMTQSIDYSLEKIDGDLVTLSVEITQIAPPGQRIKQGKKELSVIRYAATGFGRLVIDLTKPVAVTELTLNQEITLGAGRRKVDATTSMSLAFDAVD